MTVAMVQSAKVLILCGFMATYTATVQAQQKKDPLDAFQGQWNVVSLAYADFEIKGSAKKPIRVIFTKNRMVTTPGYQFTYSWAFQLGGNGSESGSATTMVLDNRGLEATIKIDPNKIFGEIDLEETELQPLRVSNDFSRQSSDKNPGRIFRKAIYRFKNDDLELCIGAKSGNRPTDFIASYYSALLHLAREKK